MKTISKLILCAAIILSALPLQAAESIVFAAQLQAIHPAAAVSIAYNPAALETTVIKGTSTLVNLTLTNNSTTPTLFELHENLGGWTSDQFFPMPEKSQSLSPVSPESRRSPNNPVPSASLQPLNPDSLLINEGFEAGVVPPGNWSEMVTNHSYNWESSVFGAPHSGDYAANVDYDDKPQDEWLLSPALNLTDGMLSFWSQGSLYWCRDTYDNCDLKIWIVIGEIGGTDDVYLGKADNSWVSSWT